jgi:hypothetical protein
MDLEFSTTHPLIIAQTQVSLPRNAFIRALPFLVEKTQRLRLDALVLCAEILASAYIQMIELALRSKWDESRSAHQRSGHLDVGMFQTGWTIWTSKSPTSSLPRTAPGACLEAYRTSSTVQRLAHPK